MTRSRFIPILLVFVGVAVAACEAELTTRERVVEAEFVEERFDTLARLLNNARVDSVLGLFHAGSTVRLLWPDGRRSEGLEAVEAEIRDLYRNISYMNFVPQSPQHEVLSRRVALTTFRHSTDIVLANGRRQPVSSGQGTALWVKDDGDGTWKIHVLQIAVNAPALPSGG